MGLWDIHERVSSVQDSELRPDKKEVFESVRKCVRSDASTCSQAGPAAGPAAEPAAEPAAKPARKRRGSENCGLRVVQD